MQSMARGGHVPGKRDRLARQRHAVGMTQEQLAAALGVERSTIYRWESGKVAPRPDVQPKLARALSVSPDELANLLMIEAGLSLAPATTGPRDASRPQQTLTEFSAFGRAHDYPGSMDLGGSPRDFLAGTVVETPLPTRLGWTEVEHVRATTRAVAMSENFSAADSRARRQQRNCAGPDNCWRFRLPRTFTAASLKQSATSPASLHSPRSTSPTTPPPIGASSSRSGVPTSRIPGRCGRTRWRR
ncbi:helix-turn-helix transcriptional regulator [Saccharopolyspora sp. ID03-671]|uniref:helix-turn-helix domain-containing protein n=1 Tax=Saccharopolyspora sp. ID03-671 TaxID=3073066 RepID=UPI003246DA4E